MTLLELHRIIELRNSLLKYIYFNIDIFELNLYNSLVSNNYSSKLYILKRALSMSGNKRHQRMFEKALANLPMIDVTFRDYHRRLFKRIEISEDEYVHDVYNRILALNVPSDIFYYNVDAYESKTNQRMLLIETGLAAPYLYKHHHG